MNKQAIIEAISNMEHEEDSKPITEFDYHEDKQSVDMITFLVDMYLTDSKVSKMHPEIARCYEYIAHNLGEAFQLINNLEPDWELQKELHA